MRGRLFAAIVLAAAFGCTAIAGADEAPTYGGPISPTEAQFIQSMQRDLNDRFPHVTDAEKAGYVRYTGVDDTGAISYANKQWVSNPTHPSQLWYDKNGDLLGADFSVPRPNGEPRPRLWGIDPGRWVEFDGHVHYVLRNPVTGATTYDQAVWNKTFLAAGGSLQHPSADTLVKIGEVKNVADVATIFEFPTIWDLIVWAKPNPNGAFANKNPTVTL